MELTCMTSNPTGMNVGTVGKMSCQHGEDAFVGISRLLIGMAWRLNSLRRLTILLFKRFAQSARPCSEKACLLELFLAFGELFGVMLG